MQPAAVLNLVGSTPQPAAGVLSLKLLSGDVSAIPTGNVVRATVTAVADGKAEVSLNGQPVTVRAQPSLTLGTELAVRVTPSGIEAVVIPTTPSPNPTAPTPATPLVVAQPKPLPPAPTALVQVASLAATPTGPAPIESRPTATAPPATDGTVAPTSAPVAGGSRAPTAIAPAPPPPTQPLAVAPNVSVRTATPPLPPAPGQPAPKTRGEQRATRSTPATESASSATPPPRTNGRASALGQGISTRVGTQPQLSVVEVLTPSADGTPRVRVDGRPPALAESTETLTPGTKRIAQVERTPQGVRVIPVPVTDSPQTTTAVAAAILKQERPPPVAVSLPKLARELETLAPTLTAKPAVVQAAAEVRESVRALLPEASRPPSAHELRSLVEDGGQRFEAKLARQADGGDGPGPRDLKGGLLKLFEAVPALAHSQLPAARATLDGIENQQASNVLSQQTGGPLVLQVPFPDGAQWRTLHLAVEPEQPGQNTADGQARPFRMLMHVPLSELGDTWIDAGLNGEQFRAVLYLEQAAVRDRVREELPALQHELKQSGFTEVLLDVRSTADLTERQKQRGAAMTAGVPVSTSVIDARA